jgi:hypothetical protein
MISPGTAALACPISIFSERRFFFSFWSPFKVWVFVLWFFAQRNLLFISFDIFSSFPPSRVYLFIHKNQAKMCFCVHQLNSFFHCSSITFLLSFFLSVSVCLCCIKLTRNCSRNFSQYFFATANSH